jgi:hypothetical protein
MPLIFRLPNIQKRGMPTSGSRRMDSSHVTLLAGERRCLKITETTSRVSGIIKMPTATTVPAIAKPKAQAEVIIYSSL